MTSTRQLINKLQEDVNYGQFSADFEFPLAHPIRANAKELIERLFFLKATAYRIDWLPEHSIGMPRFFGSDDRKRLISFMRGYPELISKVTPLYEL